jgi:uncharacterized protein YjbI with pentapeptide repeats
MLLNTVMQRVKAVLDSETTTTVARVGEVVGKLAIFAGIVSWLWEIPDRAAQRQNTAWLTLNSAQGKPGDGGRRAALEGLTRSGASLAGADLSKANLANTRFQQANLDWVNFSKAELMNAKFGCDWKGQFYKIVGYWPVVCSQLSWSIFDSATDLKGTDFSNVIAIEPHFEEVQTFYDTSFEGAFIEATTFAGAMLNTNFRNAILFSLAFKNTTFKDSGVIFENALLVSVDLSTTDADEKMFTAAHASLCNVTLPKMSEPITTGCDALYELEKRQSITDGVASNYFNRRPYTINKPLSVTKPTAVK